MSSPELVPTARGFDSSLGYLAGAEDHWEQRPSEVIECKAFPTVDGTRPVDLLHNGRPATGENGTSFGGYLWEQEALRVVREHPLPAPLYLYYAYVATSPADSLLVFMTTALHPGWMQY